MSMNIVFLARQTAGVKITEASCERSLRRSDIEASPLDGNKLVDSRGGTSMDGFWKWSTPDNLPSGDRCSPAFGDRGKIAKGFVGWIVHWVREHAVKIVEEVETGSKVGYPSRCGFHLELLVVQQNA